MTKTTRVPIMLLGNLLGVTAVQGWRRAKAGRYGLVSRDGRGRQVVRLAEVERAHNTTYTPEQIDAAAEDYRAEIHAKTNAALPTKLEIQLRTTLDILDNMAAQKRRGELFTREQVLGIVEFNLSRRDLQWARVIRRTEYQGPREGDPWATIPAEIPERMFPENNGDPTS